MNSQYANHQISKSSSQISLGNSIGFVYSVKKLACHSSQLVFAEGLRYCIGYNDHAMILHA